MKILQISKIYPPDSVGGVEQTIKTIALETEKLGAKHSLLTLSPHPREDQVDGLPVIRCKKNFEIASCPFSLEFFRKFKTIAQGFDILHFHYPWPFAELTYLLRVVDRPALVTFHADALKHPFLKKVYKPLKQAFFKKVNYIVPTSIPLRQTSPDLKDFQDKCRVIPLGIDPQSYSKPNSSAFPNLGQGFVLFVGVLRHYKGLHTLIEAAKNVSIPIVIAGAGPLQNELADQIKTLNLSNVQLIGRISDADKVALYERCAMVVLPSQARAEAFGITLLEGLMHKKPLISTELGTGTSYVNQHQKTGLVIDPEDPQALACAIIQLTDPVLATQMGQAGYEWFLSQFQSAIMGQRYFELYQDLLK